MIEELEAEAVLQMVNGERGGSRDRVIREHHGVDVEVRARRRRDGAAVLCYSYDGIRLERSVLLALVCSQAACERSQSAKRQWDARHPPLPSLLRRPRTGLKTVHRPVEAKLFDEVQVEGFRGACVARPASFAVRAACPVNAHAPAIMQMDGWDLFKNGKYLAGGLIHSNVTGSWAPKFPSIEKAFLWACQTHE